MIEIVQNRLAAINEEQRKLRALQEEAVAARDRAIAQLASFRDLELRLDGAAQVLREVVREAAVQPIVPADASKAPEAASPARIALLD